MTDDRQLEVYSLRLFVKAVELGSLSRAANHCGLALAAVSRRIQLLEDFYGVVLLTRTGRGVTPTPAGQGLLGHAHAILRRLDLARADLADYACGLIGHVSLHASTSALAQFLPSDLAVFAEERPEIRVDVREAYSGEIAARVRDGRAEVGVVVAGPVLDGLEAIPYRRDRLAVVAPDGFGGDRTSVRLRELLDQSFVLLEQGAAITRLLHAVAGASGLALRVRVTVDSFDSVCRMVQSGFGIGLLPAETARGFAGAMGLRLLDLDESWADRRMAICTNPRAPLGQAAAQLVAFLGRRADA